LLERGGTGNYRQLLIRVLLLQLLLMQLMRGDRVVTLLKMDWLMTDTDLSLMSRQRRGR
jgi:hypothetical protein